MIKQSQFSRSLWNEAKLGAYYTDTGHCARIGRLFRFPKETCVLEPSVGDGSALDALLGSAQVDARCVTFGVEINAATYPKVRERLDFCMNADFLHGTYISNKCFSFCFANPPYGATGDNAKERLETKFVERIFNLMKTDGYLVLVVSQPTLQNETFAKTLLARFKRECLYRFDDKEYSKYKQVVFIGRRRALKGALKDEYERLMALAKEEKLPYLPGLADQVAMMDIPESQEREIEFFATREFYPDVAENTLGFSGLFPMVENDLIQPKYQSLSIGQPPLKPKKDLMYLCAVTGIGQGLAGSEEGQDLHLQRGFSKRVNEATVEFDEEQNCAVEIIRSFSLIGLNVIDNDGHVFELNE